jgi:hypothetical protein
VERAAVVVSTLGVVVSIPAEGDMEEVEETMVVAVTSVVVVVISVVAMVTTDLVVGVVTLAVAGLAMAPVEVAMATAARSLLREEDIIMLLVVVMQGTEAGVATRAMAMVALVATAILYRGKRVARRGHGLMEIGTTLGMAEISKDGAQDGVVLW